MSANKTVWITGAGSGIGKALALGYAQKGWIVILSGRTISKLNEVAEECNRFGSITHIIPFDLSRNSTIQPAVNLASEKVERIDLLINNGGTSQRSLISETPLEVDRAIFETNYFGTITLTKAVLPWMVKKGGGTIAVVSSISGLFGFPLRASYSASKHALSGYFETIGLEYIKQGIHTSIIYPGRIQTDISLNAITASGKPQNTMDAGLKNGMPVNVCAKKIINAIDRKKRSILVGRKELTLVYIHKYCPFLFWKIAPNIDPK